MVLEIVALRPLEAGEELLLDDGDKWQAAWDAHEANWQPPPNADDYVYPEDMDVTETLRTMEEQKKDPYPLTIKVRVYMPPKLRDCVVSLFRVHDISPRTLPRAC